MLETMSRQPLYWFQFYRDNCECRPDMLLTLQRGGDIPLYQQLINQLRDAIRSGALPPGHRLPPVRELAAEYGLTRLTVHSAYTELQAQGLVESHVGRGTYVAAGATRAHGGTRKSEPLVQWTGGGALAEMLRTSEAQGVISLAHAFPAAQSYPLRELERCLTHVAGEAGIWGYGPVGGDAQLREQIAALVLERGLVTSPEGVIVTSGAQQGIDLTFRALTDPGDVVLVEEPTYPGALQLAAQHRLRTIGIPGDAGGIRVDALEAACVVHAPRLLYLVPTFGNPTGVSLAPERKAEIMRLAQRHGFTVVEDDVYGFLSYDGSAAPPLKVDDRHEQVIYILGFSKVLAPALRLGALVAPASMLPALAGAKHGADLVCSQLLQRALADFLRRGHLQGHLRRVRPLYRERRDVMLAALAQHLPQCRWTYPEGGLSLWVMLPEGVVERDFCADALSRGVGVVPGRLFRTGVGGDAAIRLSFGMNTPDDIVQGVSILGVVLQEHLRRNTALFSLAGRTAGPLV